LGHDQWFFFLASVLGTVAYLEEPQAAYRQHGVNAYGWIGEVKTDTRALTRLCSANGADNTAALEAACRGRADILAEAAKELTGTLGERAIAGERLYRNLEGLYAARRAVYTATEPEDRFEAFLTILRCGGYKKNSVWNFHPRNLLKDASLGVLVGHRLKRTASAPSS
jgi:hypothetical protein